MRAMVGSQDAFNDSDGEAPDKANGAVQFSSSRSDTSRDADCRMHLSTSI
jgi:hypothetical protein